MYVKCGMRSKKNTMAFQVYFRQSYRGSISTQAQCMETQLMPNESLRRDLQNMYGVALHQIAP